MSVIAMVCVTVKTQIDYPDIETDRLDNSTNSLETENELSTQPGQTVLISGNLRHMCGLETQADSLNCPTDSPES